MTLHPIRLIPFARTVRRRVFLESVVTVLVPALLAPVLLLPVLLAGCSPTYIVQLAPLDPEVRDYSWCRVEGLLMHIDRVDPDTMRCSRYLYTPGPLQYFENPEQARYADKPKAPDTSEVLSMEINPGPALVARGDSLAVPIAAIAGMVMEKRNFLFYAAVSCLVTVGVLIAAILIWPPDLRFNWTPGPSK